MSEETKYLHLLLMIYLFIEAGWCPHFSDGTSVCSVTLASSQLHSPPSQLHSSLRAELHGAILPRDQDDPGQGQQHHDDKHSDHQSGPGFKGLCLVQQALRSLNERCSK